MEGRLLILCWLLACAGKGELIATIDESCVLYERELVNINKEGLSLRFC